jgi:hypothetical protein
MQIDAFNVDLLTIDRDAMLQLFRFLYPSEIVQMIFCKKFFNWISHKHFKFAMKSSKNFEMMIHNRNEAKKLYNKMNGNDEIVGDFVSTKERINNKLHVGIIFPDLSSKYTDLNIYRWVEIFYNSFNEMRDDSEKAELDSFEKAVYFDPFFAHKVQIRKRLSQLNIFIFRVNPISFCFTFNEEIYCVNLLHMYYLSIFYPYFEGKFTAVVFYEKSAENEKSDEPEILDGEYTVMENNSFVVFNSENV